MSARPVHRAQAALLRALRFHAAPFEVIGATSRGWASATFEGSRHALRLRLEGPNADARGAMLAEALGEADLPLSGAFVADLTVRVAEDATLDVAALVIEEA